MSGRGDGGGPNEEIFRIFIEFYPTHQRMGMGITSVPLAVSILSDELQMKILINAYEMRVIAVGMSK